MAAPGGARGQRRGRHCQLRNGQEPPALAGVATAGAAEDLPDDPLHERTRPENPLVGRPPLRAGTQVGPLRVVPEEAPLREPPHYHAVEALRGVERG